MREPAEIVDALERAAELPPGSEERFSGYGVMGLPFRSGHVLGLRRFPASSIGPGYRSVWHRDPAGRWTFYQDQPAELACTRHSDPRSTRCARGPFTSTGRGPIDSGSAPAMAISSIAIVPSIVALTPPPPGGSANLRGPVLTPRTGSRTTRECPTPWV
jgi:hypothetical protein